METKCKTNLTYVEFEVITSVVMKSTIFGDITPCSPLKVNRRFRGTFRLHLQGRRISRGRSQRERWQVETLVFCSAYFSTLKMEAICSSETSVDTQRTTRRISQKIVLFIISLRFDVTRRWQNTIASFQILSNSLFTNHHTILRYIGWDTGSIVK
jgi:hypothetical protein